MMMKTASYFTISSKSSGESHSNQVYPKPSNSVKIRFSAVQEPKDVKIGSVKVLVPSDSAENECLGSGAIDDMAEEITRAVESAKQKVV